MPLVAIRIGKPSSGSAFTILLEMFPGTDYAEMSHLLNQLVHNHADKSEARLERPCVSQLLNLATSRHERECLKYAGFWYVRN